jgi:hypothetical protein
MLQHCHCFDALSQHESKVDHSPVLLRADLRVQREVVFRLKYRLYIDEVGNSDLGSSDNPNHRFLSLTGVILDLSHVQDLVHPQMETLKTKYFRSHPDDPVIFHRKEMVNAKPPFESLRNPEVRKQFDNELLNLVESWDFTVLTVCLDKQNHKETYATWRYDPYHYCLAVLLERYFFFLNRRRLVGDVIVESRGGKEDKRLKASFHRLWENGTEFLAPEKFQKVLTSRQLKVKSKSNNISGLQLTDLIAHASRNEILSEQGLLDRELAPFALRIIDLLKSKYDRQEAKVFGKKFL